MRIFRDRYAGRLRGELLLLGADYVAIGAALLFASGLCARPGRGLDAALLCLWSVIPRSTARLRFWRGPVGGVAEGSLMTVARAARKRG